MAPIENYSSFISQNSAFSMTPSICQCRAIARDCGEMWLPISRRGNFFRDSFFENARTNFHSAVQDMLSRWKDVDKLTGDWMNGNQSLANSFRLYRQLKSQGNQEDNHASTVVSDNKTHKVVIDVQDFMEGDIKVKVLGEKEVMVECQGSKATAEGSLSSTRRFCRKFSFPSTANMAEITSVISSDGVLTIEAPMMNSNEGNQSCKIIPVEIEERTMPVTPVAKETVTDKTTSSRTEKDKSGVVYYCRDCSKKIGSWNKAAETKTSQKEGVKVPIMVNAPSEKETIIPVQQESSSEQGNNKQEKIIKVEKESEEEIKQKRAHVNKDIQVKTNGLQVDNKTKQQSAVKPNCYDVPVLTDFNFLPISLRGPFLSDSFFRSLHMDFHSAVQEVLSKWGNMTSMLLEDNLSMYRNLRLKNLTEETQAVKTTEDEMNHKFLLDVHDFMDGGEVTVKALNDREIVVEGHIEKMEGGSKSQKRFLKRFSVPGNLKLDSVSSIMSSDGVLTITAPKKPSSVQVKEVILPVSVEARDDKDAAVKKIQESIPSAKMASSSNDGVVSSEHIIPIDVEGTSGYNNRQNVGHQIKVQSECAERNHETSEQRVQAKQVKEEHLIPVVIEEISDHKTENKRQEEIVQKQMEKGQTVSDRVIPINVETSVSNTVTQTNNHQKDCVIPIVVEGTSSHIKEQSYENQAKVQTKTKADNGSASMQSDKCHFAHQSAQASNSEKATAGNVTSGNLACSSVQKYYLPISRRGLFLEDAVFQDYQKNFQGAVRDVLTKSRKLTENSDCMSVYRNLRQNDLKVENQALYAQEDKESFKVAVDAKDFSDGDITVRVEGEELVIEGKAEKSKDKSSDSLAFAHRFLLPESFSINTIASAMSSDGILTVRCPKKTDGASGGVRKMSTEARSKHESHDEGHDQWEEKRVKQFSEQGDGYSSRTVSSSYSSCQQQSSKF